MVTALQLLKYHQIHVFQVLIVARLQQGTENEIAFNKRHNVTPSYFMILLKFL